MNARESKGSWKENLQQRLRDPLQVRVILTVLMLAIGYGAIYMPLDGACSEAEREIKLEKRRLALAKQVEELRVEHARLQSRLPQNSDTNEWVQYILDGIRLHPVKLVNLNSDPPKAAAPYRAVVLRIELEGTYTGLVDLLAWLETNKRLIRVDAIKIEPNKRDSSSLVAQMTVLGLTE